MVRREERELSWFHTPSFIGWYEAPPVFISTLSLCVYACSRSRGRLHPVPHSLKTFSRCPLHPDTLTRCIPTAVQGAVMGPLVLVTLVSSCPFTPHT